MLLYSVLPGFVHVASYHLGTATPILRWCPERPHLCIAQWLPGRQQGDISETDWAWDELEWSSAHPAAFVVDAPKGCMLHALAAALEPICKLRDRQTSLISWSPSCKHLLIHGRGGQSSLADASDTSGALTMISVAKGVVLASSTLSAVGDPCQPQKRKAWAGHKADWQCGCPHGCFVCHSRLLCGACGPCTSHPSGAAGAGCWHGHSDR